MSSVKTVVVDGRQQTGKCQDQKDMGEGEEMKKLFHIIWTIQLLVYCTTEKFANVSVCVCVCFCKKLAISEIMLPQSDNGVIQVTAVTCLDGALSSAVLLTIPLFC